MKRVTALICVMILLATMSGCAPQEPAAENATTTVTEQKVTTVATSEITKGELLSTTTTRTTVGGEVTTSKTKKGNTTTTVVRQTTTTTAAKTTAVNGVTLLEPQDGFVVDSQSPVVDEYMAITDDKKAAEFWAASYTGMAYSASFSARWESKGMLWRVYVSEDKTFKNATEAIVTNPWYTVDNLMPGRTYYWKVVNGFGVESEVRSVTVEPTQVRWIYAEGGDNIRDMGGWMTESGKRIKYELLYRGGCIDGYNGGPMLTNNGKTTFKKVLGIRTEIDVRGSDAAMTVSPFGGEYFDLPMTQYDYIYNDKTTKTSLGGIFDVLSDESKYPIYYHCNAGADRTGTLSFIIGGLLGVSFDDLTRDFELTGFSSRGKRLRAKLNTDTLTFSADGVMQYSGSNHIAWGPLYNIMMTDYGTDSGKLSDAVANFLITECGVTQAEIDAVRRIMLG
ncbi:MAG: tyrosine-protein phosphatase [Clostridia bacterium]|nr:tyrosine-protein phosphatase [Clostridia bacterium]